MHHLQVTFEAQLETSGHNTCIPCPQNAGGWDHWRAQCTHGSPQTLVFFQSCRGEALHNSTHMIGAQTRQLHIHLYKSALSARQHVAKQQWDQSLYFWVYKYYCTSTSSLWVKSHRDVRCCVDPRPTGPATVFLVCPAEAGGVHGEDDQTLDGIFLGHVPISQCPDSPASWKTTLKSCR